MAKKRPSRKKRSNKSLFFKAVFFLVLIFSGYFLYYALFVTEKKDPAILFDEKVNEALLSSGISEEEVTERFQEEIEDAGRAELCFNKVIETSEEKFKKAAEAISLSAGAMGLAVEKKSRGDSSTEIRIKSAGRSISSLVFAVKKYHRLAIVVDDCGYSKNISSFLELGLPLTFAVMPGLPFSEFLARELPASGAGFIMHMPMEPENYPSTNPGGIALLKTMDRRGIEDMLDKALATVPGAKGMNNHMGSAFTADPRAVKDLARILKGKNMFFLDSYTTGKSVVKEIFSKEGAPVLVNNFFIDNEDDYEYMKKRLMLLKETAQKNSKTIAICHSTRKHTSRALAFFEKEIKGTSIEVVRLEELLD